MSVKKDFPPKPVRVEDPHLDSWLDQLSLRQNIDAQDELTSVADGDEFYVFDSSAGKTKKVTGANLSSYVGATAGAGTVASVGFVAGDIFSVGGSPITTSGTISLIPTDPGADRIVFWDDSAGKWAYLTVGSGLAITGTTISASGGAAASSDILQIIVATDSGNSTSALEGSPAQINTPRGLTPLENPSHILIDVAFSASVSAVTNTNTIGTIQLRDMEGSVFVGQPYSVSVVPTTHGCSVVGCYNIKAIVDNTVTTARSFSLYGWVDKASCTLNITSCVFSFTEIRGAAP